MTPNPFLDKPLLKVSRPVAACSRCRTAKIKCDGKLPSCSACERVGKASSCSGASDEFAKGKERSYVASLEGYCEKLEKEIGRLSQRTTGDNEGGGGGGGAGGGAATASITGTSTGYHPREVSDIDDLVGDFGFLSVNATSRDFRGISSTSFANLLLSVAAVESVESGHSAGQAAAAGGLPLRHEATTILQFYFDNVFPQLPFFSETSFWTSVESVYVGRFAKPFDQFIVRMVLAIAAATISQQRDDQHQQRSLAWVMGALEYAEEVLQPGSVVGLQAIMLLAQYSLVNPMRFRSWYLVGMAARVMVDLGLHQEAGDDDGEDDRKEADKGISSSQRQNRRRVFHCLYCLDRGVSSALGRTFSFSDASVDVALPSKSSTTTTSPLDWTQQSQVFHRNTNPGLYLVGIRRILSLAYQDMTFNDREPAANPLPEIWTRCADAQAWLDQAPTNNVPRHFPVLYRLEYLYTAIVILSPSHRYPRLHDFNKTVLLDRCMQYIDQLHQALDILPFLTLIDIQRAYQVGRRFVDLVSQGVLSLPVVPGALPPRPGTALSSKGNPPARALRCLHSAQALFRYSGRRWGVYSFLEQFELAAASVQWLA